MADPIDAFEMTVDKSSFDPKTRAVLYDAFMEGWSVGDQLKRQDPPHRIFDNRVDNDLIEDFYDAGREKYHKLSYGS